MNAEDLLSLVRKVAGEARPGEQVEAYAARSQGTEVKVFGGEVESLAAENVEGVGVRVLADAAGMAVERAVRLLGATQPKSRKVAVVFDPLVASSILGVIAGALNGESVLKGRSMFATRLGEMV